MTLIAIDRKDLSVVSLYTNLIQLSVCVCVCVCVTGGHGKLLDLSEKSRFSLQPGTWMLQK